MKTVSVFVLLLATFALTAFADVRCSPVFGNHMVLQRDRAVTVWGEATPGEAVTVEFASLIKTANADTNGQWRVALDPLPASAEPRTLIVRGINTLTFSDVLVGEVWFCSGQSNMEKQLGPRHGQKPTDNFEAELAKSGCPSLRLFQGRHAGKPLPGDVTLQWLPSNADALTRMEFSAAAYYFGRELVRELGVPVGLIHSSFGGTRIEAWMPAKAFAGDPALRGLEKVRYDKWVDGVQATELFESRVKPYVPFTLHGFLWYQGETNVMNAEDGIYADKMRALIRSWRTAWNEPDAPFYYVLLAPFLYSHQTNWAKQLTPDALPAVWEAQIDALDLVHTGIVTTTDLVANVKDIHPTNKRDVGVRLARLALADTYGRIEIAARSPRYSEMTHPLFGHKLEITFQTSTPLHTRDNQPPTGFAVAGEDRVFHPAEAVIDGSKVVVTSELVKKPVAVRFAWSETANPNLVNAAGLPALPFRTDDWPLVLERPKTAPNQHDPISEN